MLQALIGPLTELAGGWLKGKADAQAAAANLKLVEAEAKATIMKSAAGTSQVVSDSSGTATLQNIDALDATTEATIEAAIDTLSNLTSVGTIGTGTWQASIIARNYGGTGIDASSLSSGQLLIGGASGFAKATLGSSTGISITNGDGTITINNTGVQSLAVGTGWSGVSVNSSTGAVSLSVGSGSNAYGARTISTSNPSGGSDGDIWYKY